MLESIPVRLAAGLGLFLWGMALMSKGLRAASGESMRRVLASLTGHHFTGLVAGTLVTAVIQSSSATTVMVIGLVNGGLMTLSQALGVIMGANIGTTLTAHLIAFELTAWALPAMGLGTACFLFGSGRVRRGWARATFGFGCLFWGMGMMGRAVEPLARSPVFVELVMEYGRQPLLGVMTGVLMTAVVQSSSATIGMLQALAGQGLVGIAAALPVLFGDNIGTCVTALLAGLGASANARRAAVLHLLINTLGALVFLVTLPLVVSGVARSSPDIVRQIANAHTLFNVVSAALLLPFAGYLLQLACRLVPGEPTERPDALCLAPRYLSPRERQTAAYLLYLGRTARHLLAASRVGVAPGGPARASSHREILERLADLQLQVAACLRGTGDGLPYQARERHQLFLGLAHDLAGIAGSAGDLWQLAARSERGCPSPELMGELDAVQQAVIGALGDILVCLEGGQLGLARRAAYELQGAALKSEQLRRQELARAGQREGPGKCQGGAAAVHLQPGRHCRLRLVPGPKTGS